MVFKTQYGIWWTVRVHIGLLVLVLTVSQKQFLLWRLQENLLGTDWDICHSYSKNTSYLFRFHLQKWKIQDGIISCLTKGATSSPKISYKPGKNPSEPICFAIHNIVTLFVVHNMIHVIHDCLIVAFWGSFFTKKGHNVIHNFIHNSKLWPFCHSQLIPLT